MAKRFEVPSDNDGEVKVLLHAMTRYLSFDPRNPLNDGYRSFEQEGPPLGMESLSTHTWADFYDAIHPYSSRLIRLRPSQIPAIGILLFFLLYLLPFMDGFWCFVGGFLVIIISIIVLVTLTQRRNAWVDANVERECQAMAAGRFHDQGYTVEYHHGRHTRYVSFKEISPKADLLVANVV
jgi:hypothetical protein